MKTLRDAALFVKIYQMKGVLGELGSTLLSLENPLIMFLTLGQIVGAQFPNKLGNYVEDLKKQTKEFDSA